LLKQSAFALQVIIGLLRSAMVRSGGSQFLIDGFPRALDQAEMFERMVKPAELVLAFDCPEEVMEARLLKRGETSGRSDDNAATIRKRFDTFVSQSMPVISHYEQLGKCHRISAIPTPDEVFEAVQAVVEGKVCGVSAGCARRGWTCVVLAGSMVLLLCGVLISSVDECCCCCCCMWTVASAFQFSACGRPDIMLRTAFPCVACVWASLTLLSCGFTV
jgi:hypothetical protein